MIFVDDLHRAVEVSEKPIRIISLVPSITELLFDLGLSSKLVGMTNFCIHPKGKLEGLEKLGGPKDFSLEKIRELKPDLIIAVKEENNKELVLEIAKEFPLVVFDVVDLNSALQMIEKVGHITGKSKDASRILASIEEQKAIIKQNIAKPRTACYLIWNKPMMSINKQNFISEMMFFAGFDNVFKDKNKTYPEITELEIKQKSPDYILLSSEPFSFTEKHKQEYKDKFPDSKVILVDGEMFSWYGSRIEKAFGYFASSFVEK